MPRERRGHRHGRLPGLGPPASRARRHARHALDRAASAVARAAAGGAEIAFIPSDSTRSDPAFLVEMWKEAAAAGATPALRRRLDGAATPEHVASLVRRARAETGLTVGVHCHNDFGLAVANTIAGSTQAPRSRTSR